MSLNTIAHRGAVLVTDMAATGTSQATATPLVGRFGFLEIVTVAAGAGVLLPVVTLPVGLLLQNSGANALNVYPRPGSSIDEQPVDDPFVLAAGGWTAFWASSLSHWYSIQPGISSTADTYLAPAFTAFAITGQATTLEVGDVVAVGSHTFTWSTSNSGNVVAGSLSIADTTASAVLASSLANDGSEAIALAEIAHTSPGATQVWTIQGTSTQPATFSRAFTVTWLPRVHAGDSASATLDGAAILALALNPFKATPAGDYAIAGTHYKFFCHPDAMGDITAVVDPDSGGMPIALLTTAPYTNTTASGLSYALVSVTNAFGVTVDYRVFRSQYILGGTVTFRVS